MSAAGERAVDRAQNFAGGIVSAARQRERWLRAEANATDPETREQFREAAADLTQRYPELEEIEIGGAEAFARGRGHGSGARSPVHEGRRRPRAPQNEPAPGDAFQRERKAPKAAPAARHTKPARTGRRRTSGRSSPLSLSLPSGGLFWWAITGLAGVALLYVLVSSAERPGSGTAAVPTAVNGAVTALRRFLGLGDIFPTPKGAQLPAGSSAAAHPAEVGRHHGGRRHTAKHSKAWPPLTNW